MLERRVLVVDEAGPPREALARMLAGEGHEVRVADANDARDQLERFKPDAIVYCADRRNDGMRRFVGEIEASAGRWRLVALGAGVGRDAGASADVGRRVALRRPINLEELRRSLREG